MGPNRTVPTFEAVTGRGTGVQAGAGPPLPYAANSGVQRAHRVNAAVERLVFVCLTA
jgi:hypothetical protein